MAEPFIKPEPGVSPAPIDEEDLFEDAGDLEFYDKNAPNNSLETLYLARVPKYMWDAWQKLTDKLGDDDEIQIGTLRTWNEAVEDKQVEGGTRNVTKLRMLLNADCPEHQALPREYELDVLDRNVSNHFIFSEEDLPGFKAKNKARSDAAKAGIPTSLLNKPKPGGGERPTYDRKSRFQPYYRKAIPSKREADLPWANEPWMY
jgi:transcription initiation factor TFIIF subunit beta